MSADESSRPKSPCNAPRPLSRRVVLASSGGVLAYGGSLALGVGCAADTGSGRTTLDTLVGPVSAEPFTNAFGWTVQLDHAYLSIGALTYFEGEPVGMRRFLRRLALPVAHAHPGHYAAGGVVAEMLEPRSVDLMAGPTLLGPSHGVQETARSARFVFGVPPAEPFDDELDSAVVRFEGSAESDGAQVHFTSSIVTADVTATNGRAEIAGCPFTNGGLPESGVVTLQVDLELWFDQVDFLDVAAGTASAPTELTADGRARRALVRGLSKAAAYRFAVETDEK